MVEICIYNFKELSWRQTDDTRKTSNKCHDYLKAIFVILPYNVILSEFLFVHPFLTYCSEKNIKNYTVQVSFDILRIFLTLVKYFCDFLFNRFDVSLLLFILSGTYDFVVVHKLTHKSKNIAVKTINTH